MIDVIVAGHLCVDFIPRIPEATAASGTFLAPGRLSIVDGAILTTGGSVGNTGVALHRLGVDVRMVARLGEDVLGQVTRSLVAAYTPRLAEELRTIPGEPGAYTLVISPPGQDRSFLSCPGPNDAFGAEDLREPLLRRTRIFHFGYPPLVRRMHADGGEALAEMYAKAKKAGATTSLDLAMPDPAAASGRANWRAILGRALPLVDVFAPSAEELLFMLRRERFEALQRDAGQAGMLNALALADVRDLAEESLGMGARIVVIKLGHRGLYLRTARDLGEMGRGAPKDRAAWQNRELWAPCFQVRVAGTVGAGDAAIAGFLTGILRGLSPELALVAAAAVGASNVEAVDSSSGVQSWEATQARIARGWPQCREGSLAVDDQGRPVAPSEGPGGPSVWLGPRDGAGS